MWPFAPISPSCVETVCLFTRAPKTINSVCMPLGTVPKQKHRCEGDDEIFNQLLNWRSRHVHLWTWAVNLRDQLTRKRLELFRRFAAALVKEYGTIFLEEFDLHWLSRVQPVEIEGIPIGAKYRVIAAPGILRQAIENACQADGREDMPCLRAYREVECC